MCTRYDYCMEDGRVCGVSMDRKRLDTANRAAQVKKDAKAYRKKRRTASKATRNGQKRIMDNVRERPHYSPKKV